MKSSEDSTLRRRPELDGSQTVVSRNFMSRLFREETSFILLLFSEGRGRVETVVGIEPGSREIVDWEGSVGVEGVTRGLCVNIRSL